MEPIVRVPATNSRRGPIPPIRETVAHFVARVSWDELEPALTQLYYDIPESHFPKYREALAILKTLKPVAPPNHSATIDIALEQDWSEDDPPQPYMDVSGADALRPDDPTRYAVEFSDWDVFLGMTVRVDPDLRLSDADVLANLIWELTWAGWTPDQSKAKMEDLMGRLTEARETFEEMDPGQDEGGES